MDIIEFFNEWDLWRHKVNFLLFVYYKNINWKKTSFECLFGVLTVFYIINDSNFFFVLMNELSSHCQLMIRAKKIQSKDEKYSLTTPTADLNERFYVNILKDNFQNKNTLLPIYNLMNDV